jgi:hypothetical protein
VIALVCEISGSSCRNASGNATVVGRLATDDHQSGVACTVEVNSETAPFYVPGLVRTHTGDEFAYSTGGQAIEDVYVQVRCQGYEPLKVERLSFRPGHTLALGQLVLRKMDRKPPVVPE